MDVPQSPKKNFLNLTIKFKDKKIKPTPNSAEKRYSSPVSQGLRSSNDRASLNVASLTTNTNYQLFEEDSSNMQDFSAFPPPVPEKPIYRCVWLLTLLFGIVKSGGFMRLNLYFPKEIWYQYDVTIECLDLKLGTIESVSELIKSLAKSSPNMDDDEQITFELESLYYDLWSLQEKLSTKLPFIKSPSAEKKVNYFFFLVKV
eukprot:TRINITY_DN5240_c0_g1_i1.p1 TRINITY_DN5240_c0_g1~~TRINITY_DN5240_c0_g1_i1.p1  ORF type:complete len:202 (+),score=33.95 TRINITY_DN5240_c0_g1_i1:21-626(+)